MTNRKIKPLTPAQLSVLPISVGEARKLLGSSGSNVSDNDIAQEILLVSELGRVLIKTLDLQ